MLTLVVPPPGELVSSPSVPHVHQGIVEPFLKHLLEAVPAELDLDQAVEVFLWDDRYLPSSGWGLPSLPASSLWASGPRPGSAQWLPPHPVPRLCPLHLAHPRPTRLARWGGQD